MVRRKIPSDRPTDPDLMFVRCPACRDADGRPMGVHLRVISADLRHRAASEPCPVCKGKLKIARAEYVTWQITHGDKDRQS